MNILTFDIEEWYIYDVFDFGGKAYYLPILNGYLDLLLDILDKRNLKATFFCLGFVAREYPTVIKRIADCGHEIGCHSDTHRWLTELSYKDLLADTKNAVRTLEDLTGKKVKSYRAPAFSINETNKWAFEILNENGIEFDSSIFPASRDFGGFPSFEQKIPARISYNGITLKEFPIGVKKIWTKEFAYSGGGYFRLMPYWLIKNIMLKSDYEMVYLHIRDFDKEQKRKLTRRYFKNYFGINWAYDKLCHLLTDFDFTNIEKADELIDWNNQPFIQL